jgi:hypothetical protein
MDNDERVKGLVEAVEDFKDGKIDGEELLRRSTGKPTWRPPEAFDAILDRYEVHAITSDEFGHEQRWKLLEIHRAVSMHAARMCARVLKTSMSLYAVELHEVSPDSKRVLARL